jgi:glycosyltransferase involved in cell wall biosynthesis
MNRGAGPLHVGLNLVYLVPGEIGGMEVVARELIPALVAAEPHLRLTAFVNREAAAAGGGPWGEIVPAVTVPVRATNRVEWVRGEQQLLPRLARREGVDLVHSLASTGPVRGRFARVVTVHDLIYKLFPEAHPGIRTLGMRVLVPLAARRSHRVLADSASTRDDLVRLLRIPAGKVDVVPLGVGATARAAPRSEEDVRARHDLGDRPLLLSVSAKRPHKNLLRLLEALALVPTERRPVLVVPGYPTWHERELRERAAALGLEGDVRFPAWVADDELEGLYAAAAAFVFPSLYEGFGMPVLEAMRRGVPVASSNASSLPEVAGDAALLFDPESPRAIADAIETVLTDPAAAERLREAGRARAARFSWEATARGVVASYERALRSARSAARGTRRREGPAAR